MTCKSSATNTTDAAKSEPRDQLEFLDFSFGSDLDIIGYYCANILNGTNIYYSENMHQLSFCHNDMVRS